MLSRLGLKAGEAPEPANGDVMVELELATLNPIDEQVGGGLVGPPVYPRTLGIESSRDF